MDIPPVINKVTMRSKVCNNIRQYIHSMIFQRVGSRVANKPYIKIHNKIIDVWKKSDLNIDTIIKLSNTFKYKRNFRYRKLLIQATLKQLQK